MIQPPWFSGWQPGDPLVWAPGYHGIGLVIPPRESDCSGERPGWWPFAVNVCDVDDPDPVRLSGRQLTVPGWP